MSMTETEIREKIQNKLNELDFQELVFVDKLLSNITDDLQKIKQTLKINNQHLKVDSLPSLKDSDFIDCFADEPDLSEKSEQLAQLILSQQK
jgi:transcription initiation factor TFIIIB Brf1 subunit/transcription initiation factor TFIIB